MKINRSIGVLCAILLAMPAASWAKKKPVDFSLFQGNYKGKATFGTLGAVVATGPSKIDFRVAKNGRKATAKVDGNLSVEGFALPIGGIFSFKARSFRTSNLVLNLGGQSSPPFTVPSKLKSSTISAFGPWTVGEGSGTVKCIAKVKSKGKNKKQLKLTYVLSSPTFGGSVTFEFVVTAKVPK